MKNRISKNFHVPLNSLSSVKTAVLTGKGPYGGGGGGQLGVPGVGTRDPRHGLGGPYTRKNFFGTQVQIHTQRPQYAKKFSPPPPLRPSPPQKGAQVRGAYRGRNPKIYWGIIFGPKMMISQGARLHTYIHWGMLREQPQKGGGIRRSHLRLI